MGKVILIILSVFCINLTAFASIREFARGSYKDKNNKLWQNVISYEITYKNEVDKFIIGKRVVSIEQI
ncbi:MAG: hypothetical protein LBT79_02415 [Elusimicrobiota bacterium]|jgi:hypothetical protein|nr:hypothetical protein [Elusimicrobiota bacterium]